MTRNGEQKQSRSMEIESLERKFEAAKEETSRIKLKIKERKDQIQQQLQQRRELAVKEYQIREIERKQMSERVVAMQKEIQKLMLLKSQVHTNEEHEGTQTQLEQIAAKQKKSQDVYQAKMAKLSQCLCETTEQDSWN